MSADETNEFDDPRVAALYDPLEAERPDLELYDGIARETGARSVLDVGCGTGTFALLLAARGVDVVGVDPAGAMLDVARAKPGADAVRWVHGDATTLPPLAVDLATMTGNVAQVFLTDDAWAATLQGIRAALRPGGTLAFETRVPARRAWERWTREATYSRQHVPGVGEVEGWMDLEPVELPFVTFVGTSTVSGEAPVVTRSTLRFRERDEVEASLRDAGFALVDVRDAPDRPGAEWVFVARRPGPG
jgi:SAM-dependent methyltransferase